MDEDGGRVAEDPISGSREDGVGWVLLWLRLTTWCGWRTWWRVRGGLGPCRRRDLPVVQCAPMGLAGPPSPLLITSWALGRDPKLPSG